MPGAGVRNPEDIINLTMKSDEGLSDYGLLLKLAESGATVVKTTDVTDTWVAVGVDNTKDATTGTVQDGAPIGAQIAGVVPIKAIAGTYRKWDKIYTAQTAEADGHVKNSSAASAVRVGTYVGPDNTVYVTGDHIEVLLIPL